MHSFSEQCLDMARSILGHNLDAIQPDGTVLPAPGEQPRPDEPGHIAMLSVRVTPAVFSASSSLNSVVFSV